MPVIEISNSYQVAKEIFDEAYPIIKKIGETDIREIEFKLEKAGAPYTPGRLPDC